MALIPSDRDRAKSVGTPLLRLRTPPGISSTTTADVNALDAATGFQFGDSFPYALSALRLGARVTGRTREPSFYAPHNSCPATGPASLLFVAFSSAPAPFLFGG